MSRTWFIATPLPDALTAEGQAVIELLRSEALTDEKADRAFAFIYAASERSIVYHLRDPLADLGVGLVTRKTLEVALDVALKGIRRGMKSVLAGLSAEQLRGVADAIEVRLYPDPHGGA